jgi:hypothetical protein
MDRRFPLLPQQRTFTPTGGMSVKCGSQQQTCRLFDHVVGTSNQRRRYLKAECLGGPEIDHQFEQGGLQNG